MDCGGLYQNSRLSMRRGKAANCGRSATCEMNQDATISDGHSMQSKPQVRCIELLESMAEEFEITARLRRWLWGDADVRADVWNSAADSLRLKAKHATMLCNAKLCREAGAKDV